VPNTAVSTATDDPVGRDLETPVLLFVFNRPDTTARVFAEVRRARPRILLIAADGPRASHPEDIERCAAVRKIVTDVDWPCDLRTKMATENLGCRECVASGLRWGFEQIEEAIILEDDCVPHPTFFRFCSELLGYYRNDPRVGMIAGTNYESRPRPRKSSFFATRHFSIWGWATWRRAFAGFDESMADWRRTGRSSGIRRAASHLTMHWLHLVMFDLATQGALDSWAIPWTFHLARQHSVALVPARNLVTNIGVAGTRGRERDPNNFLPLFPMEFPLRAPRDLSPDQVYDRLVTRRHRLMRDWMRTYWSRRIRRLLRLTP
jgi:hypothetical protein